MITQRHKTLTLQEMSENVSSGLVAFNKANQFLFIRTREQSNLIVLPCKSTAHPRVFDVLPVPLSRKGQSREQQHGQKKVAVPGLARQPRAQPRKGHMKGNRNELLGRHRCGLWKWDQLFSIFQTKDWGVSCKTNRYKVETRSGSSPRRLLSFGLSDHRVRQGPKAWVAGGDCPVLR